MAGIKRFEDIESWQLARTLTGRVHEVTREGEFGRDFGLRDQIRRASVSIMGNIAEGFERGGDREFRQFFSTAKGSAGEVKSHLYVALDARFITEQQFQDLYGMATQTGRLIGGFMTYLGRSEVKGIKFR
jgi:four helix bundle protein